MAAEVVDSEPENMIERLKSFEGTEFEVMRVPPVITAVLYREEVRGVPHQPVLKQHRIVRSLR